MFPEIDVRQSKRRTLRACCLKLVYDSLFTHVRTSLVHREFHRRKLLGGFGAQLRSEFQASRQCLSMGKIVLSITTVRGFGILSTKKNREIVVLMLARLVSVLIASRRYLKN